MIRTLMTVDVVIPVGLERRGAGQDGGFGDRLVLAAAVLQHVARPSGQHHEDGQNGGGQP